MAFISSCFKLWGEIVSIWHVGTIRHIVSIPDDDDDDDNDDNECGAFGGMIFKGNGNTRRKPVAVPLCLPQIASDLALVRTRAAALGTQQLTA
jgi:hypothetical protein